MEGNVERDHGSFGWSVVSGVCHSERDRFEPRPTHSFLSIPFALSCTSSLSISSPQRSIVYGDKTVKKKKLANLKEVIPNV